jgi:hypothetical protein
VAVPLAIAQQRPAHQTHHYELSDPVLAAAAQRYRLGSGGQGDRAELEMLVADDYVLVRARGKITNKAGLIALVCDPGSYTNPYTVEVPFVRGLGSTVILGGWVRLSGTDNDKPFEQKARITDIRTSGTKVPKAGNSLSHRSRSPTVPDDKHSDAWRAAYQRQPC